MASTRKNVLSTIIAFICWMFIKDLSIEKSSTEMETPMPSKNICIDRLTDDNIHNLYSGEWCVIVGDYIKISDDPLINIAFLNLRSLSDARIAARMHIKSINSVLYCRDGLVYTDGEWVKIDEEANLIEKFDLLMFIILYRTRDLFLNKIVIMGIFEASLSNLIKQAVLRGY